MIAIVILSWLVCVGELLGGIFFGVGEQIGRLCVTGRRVEDGRSVELLDTPSFSEPEGYQTVGSFREVDQDSRSCLEEHGHSLAVVLIIISVVLLAWVLVDYISCKYGISW